MNRRGPTQPKFDRWAPFWIDRRSPLPDGDYLFGNGYWTVHVELLADDAAPPDEIGLPLADGFDGWLHLSIHDRTRSVKHDWREFQRVKNEIVGPEREAVELYPAESRLVDTSNEFHLYALPDGDRFPFGWTQRFTEEDVAKIDRGTLLDYYKALGADTPYKAKQRARRE